MNFALNEEQTLLREAVERFASERYDLPRRAAYRATEAGFSTANWAALADLGLLSLPFPAELGGLGGGSVELITVMEVLGRTLAVEPVLEAVVAAGGLLSRAGTPAQLERWLPGIMAGEAHLALAHLESQARFDLEDVRTEARTTADGIELHGEKSVVLSSEAADAFIVSARAAGGNGPGDISFYIVAADARGLERSGFRLADGSRACSLRLSGAPGDKLAGGFADFAAVVDTTRVAAGAEMIGIMSMLLDSTIEYVRNRRQFGAALGSFQVIQHRLVDLYVSLELSRSQLFRAALCTDDADRARAVAGMKAYVSASAVRMGEQCIHMHGAMGTTDELPVGHAHKRLLLLATLFGDADHDLARYVAMANSNRPETVA